ncbi:M15 family metallopeptidase [Photobacterium sp. BZF1]|uniref:M15 family metallopeptidase n=1 Tax=Photobacterium sp. BZF1 TaxID=1904457 RepID=UPI001CA38703|nr:M15 family metallopeptidase [Photobacterium sp. BZF1]
MSTFSNAESLPDGFVDIQHVDSTIVVDIRYFTSDNFVGERISGYRAAKAISTEQTASALAEVQKDLKAFGLGLKVFDAYRPQPAVDHFVRWAVDLSDTRMKEKYYPTVEKKHLFRDGYIAAKSGHSRGSTVDLTLIDIASGEDLDMGTSWDYFGKASWPNSPKSSAQQRANRMLLQAIMLKHGFKPLKEEWWHFTLAEEPYPETYFSFDVK